MMHGTYGWDPAREPNLIDVSFAIPRGALCIVVGAVGSGKSCLLAALLGEMPCLSGTAFTQGSLALTTQDPWIQNATVRSNVLMGAPFVQAKYDKVVEACALQADLAHLPAGDETEIGEKGVTLSGTLPALLLPLSFPGSPRFRTCSKELHDAHHL
jgi:ABC-type multidrug transport system fused ATPase/permease subunit